MKYVLSSKIFHAEQIFSKKNCISVCTSTKAASYTQLLKGKGTDNLDDFVMLWSLPVIILNWKQVVTPCTSSGSKITQPSTLPTKTKAEIVSIQK